MLRLTLEIVPCGDEAKTRHIQTLEISRTSAFDNPENYRVVVFAANGELTSIFRVNKHEYISGAQILCYRALSQVL